MKIKKELILLIVLTILASSFVASLEEAVQSDSLLKLNLNLPEETWVELDGNTGKITLNDTDQLDISNQATWNIWVRQNQYVSNAGIFGKYIARAGKRSYIIRTVLNNGISLILSPDGINTQAITSSSNKACGIRNNGEWTMLTITYDGSHVIFYRNGVQCETKSTSINQVFNSPESLIIGGGNGVFFNGAIDDIKIYSSSLSQDKISQLYEESPHGINKGQAIPVLVYHRIEDPNNVSTRVSPKDFNEQMQFLYDNSFKSVTLKDYDDWKKGLFNMPEKAVIITFDDGYKSVYTNALPILEKYGFVGSLNLVVAYANRTSSSSGYMKWSEFQELKDKGWDVESHSVNHINMLALAEPEFREQLKNSKESIFTYLGVIPTSFTFPFHLANQTYTEICGEYYNLCWTFGSEPETPYYVYKSTDGKTYKSLQRINIYNTVTLPLFESIFIKDNSPAQISGEWKLNEGEGNIAHDTSNYKNDGILSGGFSWNSG